MLFSILRPNCPANH